MVQPNQIYTELNQWDHSQLCEFRTADLEQLKKELEQCWVDLVLLLAVSCSKLLLALLQLNWQDPDLLLWTG